MKKRLNTVLVKTDASVIGNHSTHSYHIRGIKADGTMGAMIRQKTFGKHFQDVLMAELYSIQEGLIIVEERNFKGVVVQTDSEDAVLYINTRNWTHENPAIQRDITYIRKLVDRIGAKVQYVPRKYNKLTDKLCRQGWKDKKRNLKGKTLKGVKISNASARKPQYNF